MNKKEETPKTSVDEKSTVKTYRPPDGSTPVVCIHTKPSLMKKLMSFLQHFDRPPQQLFLEFVFVEVEENDAAQFRYRLNHPMLNSITGGDIDSDLLNMQPFQQTSNQPSTRLPSELNPRM
eukprot:gene837-9086_t